MNRSAYRYLKNNIVLAIILSFFSMSISSQSHAQEKPKIEVKGLVRDANTKKPISAARISVIGTELSVVTDDKGNFTIKVPSPTNILQVAAFDYNPLEATLRGRTSLTVDLYPDQFSNNFKNYDGVTGIQRSSSLTSSFNSINKLEQSAALSADELMKSFGGDVRAITRSGVSGVGSSLFIRGLNSINANAQPLFVVDGVVWNSLYDAESIHSGFFSNTLDNIDVNDIESISVLKDGTSIYGSKASNGVVLIKTKRGNSMVTKINLNVFFGQHSSPDKFPMMGGEQFRIYASDMLRTQGVNPNNVTDYGFLETDPAKAMNYNMYHNNTDWNKEVYRQGSTQNYNIGVSGGDEKALYYFSVGYSGNNEVVNKAGLTRLNSRFNADLNLLKELSIGANIAYTQNERNSFEDGISPVSPTWMSKIKSPFTSPYAFSSDGTLLTGYASADVFGIGNPSAFSTFSDVNKAKNFRLSLGVVPTFRITPELTLTSTFDYSLDKTTERSFVPVGFSPNVYLPKYNAYSISRVTSQVMRNISLFDDTRLTYSKSFGNLHQFKAIWGWRYLTNVYESSFIQGHNTKVNSNTTVGTDLEYVNVDGINNRTKSISNYFNLDYNFDNKYFVTGTLSADGSSRFGKDTEGGFSLFGRSWGVFPSLSASWNISAEKFMKQAKFIDYLKLRAGYGLTGNDGIEDYASMAYFSIIQFMGKANGLILSNLDNPKIQWETTAKASAGLDFNLLNNRVTGNFDVYSSKTSDLLMLKDLPEVSGLGKYWENGGELTNKGFEASLNFKVLNLNALKWELGLSVGHYKNKVTSLPFGDYTTSVYDGEILSSVGHSAGVFYGYKTKGVFATSTQAETADLKIRNANGSYSPFEAGDVIFDDAVKDGVIDSKDKQIIGDPNPDYYGTFFTKVAIKRFTVTALFSYSYGNDVYNYQRSMLESGLDYSNQTSAMLNRWTAEGQVTTQPKAYFGDPKGNSRFSDRWIEDGSYIRLKTLSVTYNVPIKSNFISGFTLWASANNLATWTKYLGLDPEVSARNSVYYQGVDAGLVPPTKSFFLGVNFNL